MTIDNSIYQNIGRGVKSINDYDNEAMQGQTNRLALMTAQNSIQDTQRGRDGDNALAQLLAGGKSGADVATGLAQQGFGKQSMAYTKQVQDMAKDKAVTEKSQIENTISKLSLGAQLLGGVKDQSSYDQARATAQANGLDVSRMQPNYDPAFIASKLQEGQSVKEQLEQKWKAMEYSTPNANAVLASNTAAAGQGVTMRGQDMSAQTALAGQGVTTRGQDLTDTRARDLNAIKGQENQIKLDDKKDTANLTKASQIASFDTMLGTLERLGSHKGLARSVGATGMLPTMPGSESANFQAELNTFQSQAFLPMVAQLKGMGALSDAEGKKLTAAVGALDPKMGEEAFRASVARITEQMTAARARMTGGAANTGGATGSWGGAPSGQPVTIKSAADYANIPSGATYIAPDGKMRKKP